MTTQGQTRTRRPDDVGNALYWLRDRTKISAINILCKDYVVASHELKQGLIKSM